MECIEHLLNIYWSSENGAGFSEWVNVSPIQAGPDPGDQGPLRVAIPPTKCASGKIAQAELQS